MWFCDQQIRIDSVYSSPLIRAVETAKIIAPEAPLFIEERLIEMDYGPYEGMDLTNPAPEVSGEEKEDLCDRSFSKGYCQPP